MYREREQKAEELKSFQIKDTKFQKRVTTEKLRRKKGKKERHLEELKERSRLSGIKMDAAIALNLKEIKLCLKKLQGELIGPQGLRIQLFINPNGSAPQPLGKIATQTCFSDESCLTSVCLQCEQ